jgi:hypothetical protein
MDRQMPHNWLKVALIFRKLDMAVSGHYLDGHLDYLLIIQNRGYHGTGRVYGTTGN